MGVNLGVHVYEKATAVSTPVVADVGIPFVVGLAPTHAAASPRQGQYAGACHQLGRGGREAGLFLRLEDLYPV